MAAIVDTANSIDLRQFNRNLQLRLPTYARPIFLRLLDKLDLTGQHWSWLCNVACPMRCMSHVCCWIFVKLQPLFTHLFTFWQPLLPSSGQLVNFAVYLATFGGERKSFRRREQQFLTRQQISEYICCDLTNLYLVAYCHIAVADFKLEG